jgi:CRISPR system Cascade subunit CasB
MIDPLAKESPATDILIRWWQGLENDKGTRAELRRCDRPEAVMLHPAYARLYGQLATHLAGQWNWEWRLGAVVGLLAHVRHTSNTTLARQMGGSDPDVSELRFRRLLQCKPEELYPRMIRILRMLGNSANLSDLINSVFYWNDRIRKRWALDYFAITPEQKSA